MGKRSRTDASYYFEQSKLDVYRVALDFARWADRFLEAPW